MSKFIVYFKQFIFIENLFLMFNDRPPCFDTACGEDGVGQWAKIYVKGLYPRKVFYRPPAKVRCLCPYFLHSAQNL